MRNFRKWSERASFSFLTVGFVILVGSPLVFAESPSKQEKPQSTGLLVEKIESGFALTPDFKFTEVDDQFANLAGAYGGWIHDRRLLIGAAAIGSPTAPAISKCGTAAA